MWREFFILNQRKERLAALLKLPVKEGQAGSGAGRPLVVVCHGFKGGKEGGGRAMEMGRELAAMGLATLLFDFSGCGASEGTFADVTLSRQVDDVGSVMHWAREEGYGPIYLQGRSFGGTTALCYAARDAQVAGVCTWAAPAQPYRLFSAFARGSLEGAAGEPVEIQDEEGKVRVKRKFFYDLKEHDILCCARALASRPLLVIQGTADAVVPPEDANLLFQAAREPRELVMIEGADHRFTGHMPRVWEEFFGWLSSLTSSSPGDHI